MSSDVNISEQQSGRGNAKHGKPTAGQSKGKDTADAKAAGSCPWKVGQRVEACDSHGNWYPAKILDIQDFKLLIHFQRWSSRFDEWFDVDSDLVRITQESKKNNNMVAFKQNDRVLARWSDSKLYPATIIKLFDDRVFCHVRFDDGYRKKVKLNAIERMPPEYGGDKLPPLPQPKPFVAADPTNHNDFICDMCKKGFRKESLLTSHKKHYHNITENNVGPNAENHTMPISTSNENNNSEVKDANIESETLKSLINVKTETASDEDNTKEASILLDDTTTNEAVSKKRKNKECKQRSIDSSYVATKRLKTQSSVYSPITNPYSYYYEPKSSKKPKLNLSLPFSIQNTQVIVEAHDNDNIDEIVKCTCDVKEENGLMVQCELCLSWQHGLCMGFSQESDVPDDGYFCPFCRSPPKASKSQKNSYQLNHWLKNALAPAFVPANFEPTSMEAVSAHSFVNNEQTKLIKLESDSNSTFEGANIFINSGHPTPFDSYFPNASLNCFTNQPTITTTTMANNNAISSVSECNKDASLSLGPFLNSAKPPNDFDIPPSTGLFSSVFPEESEPKDTKKTFVLHDFSNHHTHNNVDMNIDDEHIDSLIDMNLKSDYFSDTKLLDEETHFANQVKATNMLSSALLDIMANLHSLNYKIAHHSDVASAQIIEKQEKLQENIQLIEAKLEKIEKEMELKDSYAIHTSSSTLTATSPENFGFSDINNSSQGLNGTLSSQPTLYKNSFVSNIAQLDSAALSSSSESLVFANSNSFENQTLSTLNAMPSLQAPVESSNFYPNLMNNKPFPSSSTSNICNSNDIATETFKIEPPESPPSPTSKSLCSSSLNRPPPQPFLARLYLPPGNSSNSAVEHELLQTQRPSMSHEYLPLNMSDADLKLEIAYHYQDLRRAREIVLSLE